MVLPVDTGNLFHAEEVTSTEDLNQRQTFSSPVFAVLQLLSLYEPAVAGIGTLPWGDIKAIPAVAARTSGVEKAINNIILPLTATP